MVLRDRRVGQFVGALLLACALLLTRDAVTPASAPRVVEAGGGGPVSVYGFYDLPRDLSSSHDISGLAWDAEAGILWGIRDRDNTIVALRPSPDFRSWSFAPDLTVDVGTDQWDGEGIVRTERGFFITNEFGPRIYEINLAGQIVAEMPIHARFSRIRPNLSFEALSRSPDYRYLFTANEQALETDGPVATLDAGTTVRIVRYDRNAGNQSAEYAYRTDAVFARPIGSGTGDRGVVEIVALSATDLLVMERSFVPGVGNNVRIYRVNLAGAADVRQEENLGPHTPVLAKTLVVDLADLPDGGFPTPLQPQPNRILDNFEGMALGPRLPDGRRLLFLVSDDNSRATQTPRLLTLAIAGL